MPFGHGFRCNDSWDEAPGSSSFDPASVEKQPDSIAGLTQWYKSDVGLTGSPTDITAWTDQSTQSNDLADVAATPNITLENVGGIDFVRINGNGNALTDLLSVPSQPDGLTQFHFFSVLNRVDAAGQRDILSWPEGTNLIGIQVGYPSGTDEARLQVRHAAGFETITTAVGSWLQNETVILEVEIDLSLGTSEEMKLTLNNFEQATGASSATTFFGGTGSFVFGGTNTNASDSGNCRMAELIVYNNKVLDAGDRIGVLNYLSNKYSITLGA